MLRAALQDLNRLRQIAQAIARYGFASLFSRDRVERELGVALDSAPADVRDAPAVRFRRLLEELGPTFVKLGQVLSTRADILPSAYSAELARLRDAAPPLPFAEVRAVIEASLHAPIESLFAAIDETPLACASIACVHGARLKDGREVVVKVQRPGIHEVMRADLDLLAWFAAGAEAVFLEATVYRPSEIVEELEGALLEELDFRQEAENLHRFRRLFEQSSVVYAPAVIGELSSATVLTLELLRGTRLGRMERGSEEARRAALQIIDAAYEQVFVHGYFHADPHPGNLLLLEDGRLGILDFGLVGHLSPEQRDTIIAFCLAISLRNADALARLVLEFGRAEERVEVAALRKDIASLLDRFWGVPLDRLDPASLIQDLLDLAIRHRVRMPRELALLAKALVTVEGSLRALDPELDIAVAARPYLWRLLRQATSPERVAARLTSHLYEAHGALRSMPGRLDQVLTDLGSGRFGVRVESEPLRNLDWAIHRAALLVTLGFVSAAGIVSGTLIAVSLGSVWGWVVAVASAALAAAAVVASIASTFLGKARVSWFFRRRRPRRRVLTGSGGPRRE